MSRKTTFTKKPLIFGSFSRLIDALMLFGASIEVGGDRGYRLSLCRTQRRGAPLAWAVIVVESQDPLFDFLQMFPGMNKGTVRFRTRHSRFMEEPFLRWYSSGNLKLPSDIVIDTRAMLFWLLGAWTPAGDIRLPLMGSNGEVLRKAVPWPVEVTATSLVLASSQRRVLERWLASQGVPEVVWR